MKDGREVVTVTRRAWLKGLLYGLGAGFTVTHRLSPTQAGEEGPASTETGPLTVRVTRPYDAETPVREFTSYLTPNHRFFVRSHFGPPPPEARSPLCPP